jgi:hypothetical protein
MIKFYGGTDNPAPMYYLKIVDASSGQLLWLEPLLKACHKRGAPLERSNYANDKTAFRRWWPAQHLACEELKRRKYCRFTGDLTNPRPYLVFGAAEDHLDNLDTFRMCAVYL